VSPPAVTAYPSHPGTTVRPGRIWYVVAVYDFLRAHNLSIAQAQKVSPYLPVYAEFTAWEGGY
jgi:hypothetical protein